MHESTTGVVTRVRALSVPVWLSTVLGAHGVAIVGGIVARGLGSLRAARLVPATALQGVSEGGCSGVCEPRLDVVVTTAVSGAMLDKARGTGRGFGICEARVEAVQVLDRATLSECGLSALRSREVSYLIRGFSLLVTLDACRRSGN